MKNKINIFALGTKNSAAYNSIIESLEDNFNIVCFRSERDFRSCVIGINTILSSGADAVIMPNPYGNPNRLEIYQKLRAMKFPVIVFDRGGLPGSWFFDTGFNADSDSYQAKRWDRPLTDIEHTRVEKVIHRLRDESEPLEQQGCRINSEALRKKLNLEGKKVLLVPFQRPSDTTIKYFSDPIGNFENFVSLVEDVNAELCQAGSDWALIAKRHPLEVERPSRNLQFVDDETHINDLIDLADAVLVVNSGVGLLAQMWEKPVLIAGTAYYSHEKLNKVVSCSSDVIAALRDLPKVDRDARNRLFHHLTENVYSFGKFETQRVKQSDGAYRNITRQISFDAVNTPKISAKKRILFVTSVIPYPINRGSALRTDHSLRALLQTDQHIDVLLLNQSEAATENEDLITRLQTRYPGAGFTIVKHPIIQKITNLQNFRDLITYRLGRMIEHLLVRDGDLNSLRHNPYALRTCLKKMIEQRSYDTIVFNYLKLIPPGFKANGSRIIADLHDVQADRIKNDVLPKVNRLRRKTYFSRAVKSETLLLNKCDIGICISERDKQRLQERYGSISNLKTFPASADLPTSSKPKASALQFDFLFVGSNSDPNVDGICWFLENCWPLITLRLPEATLLVQGGVIRNTSVKRALAAQTDGSVFQSGFVEDLSRLYDCARTVICPIRYGTGMKIKVIEAMSHGKALVATPAALEGVDLPAGLKAIEGSENFADACVALRNDDDLWNTTRYASTETFERNHTFQKYVEKISSIVR
ncbi:glycosyltransferase [Roseibium aggregatum]|uniref:Sugar transferase, PEP-CTERM/EpsH1 system associated n=1 Tax=Roseibium aggregatum TaxID=187304 RepID=A0A0M6Y8R7_9HYPH|nr:glycosyltransferase [Roseibium aggregatum]CTQ45381.1 sugar transferase, PEP-CTERM/EpsH1 system associated [Roseibium aggregatum]